MQPPGTCLSLPQLVRYLSNAASSGASIAGVGGRINISSATYERVKDIFDCEFRGKIQAKHKGEIDMYFVKGFRPGLSSDSNGKIPNQEFFALYQSLEKGQP